jgi:hypothetical protein
MKRLRWLIVFGGFAAAGCPSVTPAIKPIVVDCAAAVSADILPAIESALVAGDYVAELTALATKFGLCTVNKAITQLMGEAISDQSFASGDINARLKINHGNVWLAAHPVPAQ